MIYGTRLVKTPLNILYQKINTDSDFKDEFDLLSQNNDDPIGAWLKTMRAKGKVVDESEPLFQLVIELHRKIDLLSASLQNQSKEYKTLKCDAILDSIGHNVIIFKDDVLEPDSKYYGRLDMAVFPKRLIPLYFVANSNNSATIYLMHDRDVLDYDNYIASRERALIRERKNQTI